MCILSEPGDPSPLTLLRKNVAEFHALFVTFSAGTLLCLYCIEEYRFYALFTSR
jgi:hypothetical protein